MCAQASLPRVLLSAHTTGMNSLVEEVELVRQDLHHVRELVHDHRHCWLRLYNARDVAAVPQLEAPGHMNSGNRHIS